MCGAAFEAVAIGADFLDDWATFSDHVGACVIFLFDISADADGLDAAIDIFTVAAVAFGFVAGGFAEGATFDWFLLMLTLGSFFEEPETIPAQLMMPEQTAQFWPL